MSKPGFPITVKRGHAVVKIYRTPSRGCEAFTVSYYLGDQRQRKTFADLGLATTEAETVANKLSTGEVNVLTLTSDNRLSYIRAIEALKPTGVPLEMAAMQFAGAQTLLERESLLDAASNTDTIKSVCAKDRPEHWTRRQVLNKKSRRISPAAFEFIA